MSEEKIQNTKEVLLELSRRNFAEVEKVIMSNGANAINYLQQERDYYKNIVEELKKYINDTKN